MGESHFRGLDLDRERERMVEKQLARRGVRDIAVLGVMREVPREVFVPEHLRDYAYEDGNRRVSGWLPTRNLERPLAR